MRDVSELRTAEAEVALEMRIRAALAESLHDIPQEASVAEAAQAICDKLVTLPFIDVAGIDLLLGTGDLQIIAQSAPPASLVAVGDHILPIRSAAIRERAQDGPWAEYVTADPAAGFFPEDVGTLKALAYGPIMHGNQMVGCLTVGTVDERFARTLVEQMPAVVSFSTTSSALLAERLHTLRREAELRAGVVAIIAGAAFHPVFQPIVDLASGETVGYEALTRFDSGQRPDLCFADAWSVGLGPDLEIATLEAAVAAGKRLPPGLWLDLNASPRLLADRDRLSAVLSLAQRPIVLEVTEHEVIEDYDAVRQAISSLGPDLRLAVDDAGVGVANFGHIIELRPDFVKLDISLVRRVNANLGRQALVVAMRHFSRTAGCRLIAEGVETDAEAATLRSLGVEYGQGFLFGHPERVEIWVADEPAQRPLA
jgi:EAL domain-containing protein (putative c-di-GMP-specific phosphodiesterase class I)